MATFISELNEEFELFENRKELVIDDSYELVIIAGWIDRGHFDKQSRSFLRIIRNRKVAFVFTLTAYGTSSHAYDSADRIKKELEENGNKVIDFFWTQAPLDPKLMERMYKLDKDHPHYPDESRIIKWKIAENHPNEEDFEVAKNFYHQVVRKMENGNQ